jgi:succinate dehydrogenase / fumarate reductase iron-sulfur subunit
MAKKTKKVLKAVKKVAKKPVKAAAKKAAKPAPKKPVVKKVAAKKPAVKKATVKKAIVKKAVVKKVAQTPAKKVAPKAAAQAKAGGVQRNMAKRSVTFRITRGEQVNGKFESYVEEFKVRYDDTTSVLQALEDIKAQQDGSLTFRRSCRASICGSCGMFINGRSRLACQTKIKDMVNGVPEKNIPPSDIIEIRAQNNQEIIKDLVVDISDFYKKVEGIKPFVAEGPEKDASVNKQSFEQVNMVSNCIMCGLCYSDCTALNENPDFTGPAALAKAFRFVSDPREGNKTERLEKLSEKNGIWDCTRCGMCVDACPKGVAPMEAIVKLRTRAMAAGVDNNPGARHAMAFKNDIASTGQLNEPMLLVKTLQLGVLGQVGNALHLAKKGKIPELMPHKIERVDEVAKMFKALEENPISVETRAEDKGPGAG